MGASAAITSDLPVLHGVQLKSCDLPILSHQPEAMVSQPSRLLRGSRVTCFVGTVRRERPTYTRVNLGDGATA